VSLTVTAAVEELEKREAGKEEETEKEGKRGKKISIEIAAKLEEVILEGEGGGEEAKEDGRGAAMRKGKGEGEADEDEEEEEGMVGGGID